MLLHGILKYSSSNSAEEKVTGGAVLVTFGLLTHYWKQFILQRFMSAPKPTSELTQAPTTTSLTVGVLAMVLAAFYGSAKHDLKYLDRDLNSATEDIRVLESRLNDIQDAQQWR